MHQRGRGLDRDDVLVAELVNDPVVAVTDRHLAGVALVVTDLCAVDGDRDRPVVRLDPNTVENGQHSVSLSVFNDNSDCALVDRNRMRDAIEIIKEPEVSGGIEAPPLNLIAELTSLCDVEEVLSAGFDPVAEWALKPLASLRPLVDDVIFAHVDQLPCDRILLIKRACQYTTHTCKCQYRLSN